MRTQFGATFVIGVLLTTGCGTKHARSSTPKAAPCIGPETPNGYLDNDGCADELARVLVRVLDSENTAVEGFEVLIPGLEKPQVTAPDGTAALFELMPGAVITVTVMDPVTHKTTMGTMSLREGANHILVTVPWLPVAQPTPPPLP